MAPKKHLSGQNNPSKAKRDRKVLSLVEKTKILDLLQSGMSLAEVGRKVGKNESSIRTIKQKEAEIRGSVSAAPTTAKMVSLVRDKVLAKTEKALSVWLEDMSQKQIPVDGKIMREKALRLYEHCCEGVEESERKRFKASKGWLASYVKRYSLKILKITGESASAGGEAFSDVIQDDVEEHVEEHRETLTNEELEDLLKSSTEILHIGAVGTMQQSSSSSSSSSSYEGYQERRTRVVMASHEALQFIKQEKEDAPSPVVPPDPTEKFDDAVADLIIIKVEEDTERPEQLRDIHGRLATGDQNLFKVEQDIGQGARGRPEELRDSHDDTDQNFIEVELSGDDDEAKETGLLCAECGNDTGGGFTTTYKATFSGLIISQACARCGKTLEDAAPCYDAGRAARTNVAVNLHLCDVCGKGFSHYSYLKVHYRKHTGEKPLICGVCSKGFSQHCSLKRHSRIHTGEKPHKCNDCGKEFREQYNLKIHSVIHTGGHPYECVHCGRVFTHHVYLKSHSRTHTGEKPHACKVCGRKFSQQFSLKRHIRTHTGEKPHVCKDCGKGFSQSSSLKRHSVVHVGENLLHVPPGWEDVQTKIQ